MEIFKNPNDQAQNIVKKRKGNNTFSFNGKDYWSGAISSLDGAIEEVHPYKRAQENDFHHSFYFSEPAIERIANGESLFFYVDEDGNVNIDPTGRGQDAGVKYDANALLEKLKRQIKI